MEVPLSLENELHALVTKITGVAAVYKVNPLWRSLARQLSSRLATSAEDSHAFVDLSEESRGDAHVVRVRMRVGSDGSIPAPDVARSVAAHIRAHICDAHPKIHVVAAVEISAIAR